MTVGDYRGPSKFDYIMRYAIARANEKSKDALVARYVCDALYYLPRRMGLTTKIDQLFGPSAPLEEGEVVTQRILSKLRGGIE